MSRTFSADEFGQAVAAAKQSSLQHAGCAIHLTATLRTYPIADMKPPVIAGYRISDWFDEAVIATFVDGQAVGG